jgi:hypothetical protein
VEASTRRSAAGRLPKEPTRNDTRRICCRGLDDEQVVVGVSTGQMNSINLVFFSKGGGWGGVGRGKEKAELVKEVADEIDVCFG